MDSESKIHHSGNLEDGKLGSHAIRALRKDIVNRKAHARILLISDSHGGSPLMMFPVLGLSKHSGSVSDVSEAYGASISRVELKGNM
jgi:hypothetical protein